MVQELSVRTSSKTDFIDITSQVQKVIADSNYQKGVLYLFAPHTTAAVTINENADPSVVRDIDSELTKVIPFNGHYLHTEGNAAAHIKSTLVGCSEVVLIEKGRLVLGTWQGVFFCEFDGPRTRKVLLQFIPRETSG